MATNDKKSRAAQHRPREVPVPAEPGGDAAAASASELQKMRQVKMAIGTLTKILQDDPSLAIDRRPAQAAKDLENWELIEQLVRRGRRRRAQERNAALTADQEVKCP